MGGMTKTKAQEIMTINLNIKANVNNLSLSDIYELLNLYSLEKQKDNKIMEFKGFKFKIETEINMSINYVITEMKQLNLNSTSGTGTLDNARLMREYGVSIIPPVLKDASPTKNHLY